MNRYSRTIHKAFRAIHNHAIPILYKRCPPEEQEFMIREIHIKAVLNGFVVNVGCQSVVFESVKDMFREMEAYLKDPSGTEKDWLSRALNAKHTIQGDLVREAPEPRNYAGEEQASRPVTTGGLSISR